MNTLGAMMEKLDEKYVTVNGIRVRYGAAGNGPPVLLIHGFGEFLEVWWFNIAALSEYFAVYAVDLPGHGLSQEPVVNYTLAFSTRFIVDFMGTLGIEHASMVAHSLGGLVCLNVAISFPRKVDKLVLVDSGGLSKEVPLLYRLATLPVLGDIILKPTLKAAIRAGMKKGFYNPEIITKGWVNTSYKYMKMPRLKDALLNIIRSNTSIDGLYPEATVTDKLHSVKSPTLIVHGAQDQVIPVEYARSACKLIPKARLKIFDECGHCPHIEKASQFDETVVAFLRADEAHEAEQNS